MPKRLEPCPTPMPSKPSLMLFQKDNGLYPSSYPLPSTGNTQSQLPSSQTQEMKASLCTRLCVRREGRVNDLSLAQGACSCMPCPWHACGFGSAPSRPKVHLLQSLYHSFISTCTKQIGEKEGVCACLHAGVSGVFPSLRA